MITWIRSWLRATVRSAYDVTFYAETIKNARPHPVRHLYGALWLTSLVISIVGAVALAVAIPSMRAGINSTVRVLPTIYPPELVVTISKGTVKTNVKEPYVINMPPEWQKFFSETKNAKNNNVTIKHLVTIDTDASAEDFPKYESALLITKHSAVYPDQNGGLKVHSLQGAKDMTMTKQVADEVLGKILPYAQYLIGFVWVLIILMILVAPFVLAGLRLVGYFIYLAVFVSILWIIGKIMKTDRSYGQIYSLSMYGLTLPLAFGLLEFLLGFHVGFVFTLIFLGWMLYVFSKLQPAKAEKIMPAPPKSAKGRKK